MRERKKGDRVQQKEHKTTDRQTHRHTQAHTDTHTSMIQ
jgi:hypothetical protein